MRSITLAFMFIWSICAYAQNDSTAFHAYLYNKEFKTYIHMNLYAQDITVPGQELLGQIPGYIAREGNSLAWIIIEADIKDDKHANLQIINDYGSEDLTATLTRENDSIYTLKQIKGSVIKLSDNGKWLKLPKILHFIRKKSR